MTKTIMDCVASVFFAGGSGWVLSLISIPLGIMLMIFTGSQEFLMPHLTAEMIGDFSACGGLIQLLNALRIAKLKNSAGGRLYSVAGIGIFISMFLDEIYVKISQSEGVSLQTAELRERRVTVCAGREQVTIAVSKKIKYRDINT